MKKLARLAARFGSPHPITCHRISFSPLVLFMPVFALAACLLLGGPAFAQATVDVGGIYGAWQPYLLAIVVPLAAAVVGLLAELVRRKLNLDIEAKHREALQTAITNGAGLALNRLGNSLHGKTIEVGSPAVAAGVNYVLKGAPEAMKKFGLGPEDVAKMVAAKLPQVANTVTPPSA